MNLLHANIMNLKHANHFGQYFIPYQLPLPSVIMVAIQHKFSGDQVRLSIIHIIPDLSHSLLYWNTAQSANRMPPEYLIPWWSHLLRWIHQWHAGWDGNLAQVNYPSEILWSFGDGHQMAFGNAKWLFNAWKWKSIYTFADEDVGIIHNILQDITGPF